MFEKKLKLNGAVIYNTPLQNMESDAFEVFYDYTWALQIVLNGDDGVTSVTLQGSNTGLNWDTLPLAENIQINNNDSISFFSGNYAHRYIRFVIATNATTGTISNNLILKLNG